MKNSEFFYINFSVFNHLSHIPIIVTIKKQQICRYLHKYVFYFRMAKVKIRAKITLAVVLMILVAISASGFFTYQRSADTIMQLTEQGMKDSVKQQYYCTRGTGSDAGLIRQIQAITNKAHGSVKSMCFSLFKQPFVGFQLSDGIQFFILFHEIQQIRVQLQGIDYIP